MSDLDETHVDPPAAVLPVLTLEEAQDVLEVLAAVANDSPADADRAHLAHEPGRPGAVTELGPAWWCSGGPAESRPPLLEYAGEFR
jgi:hypothetical protein